MSDEAGNEADASWHYRFWSYFRAHAILQAQVINGALEWETCASTIIDCFLKMGYLMLRTEDENGTLVFRGDIDLRSSARFQPRLCPIGTTRSCRGWRLTWSTRCGM
jgi:hypothetical protein